MEFVSDRQRRNLEEVGEEFLLQLRNTLEILSFSTHKANILHFKRNGLKIALTGCHIIQSAAL